MFFLHRSQFLILVVMSISLMGCSKDNTDLQNKELLSVESAVINDTTGADSVSPLKVSFVYVGPTGDAGWTYSHDKARLYLQQELGDKIEITYVENVAEGADSARVISQLARSGSKLIFATSFGYMNPTISVAKRHPDVIFEHATGYKRAENVGTYFVRAYEGRYLSGIVAGKMTKSNVLGYVASFPIPEVIRGINAFTLGAQSVNPDIKVKVVWASTWYDPGKEREAAETLIGQGADVITQHTDSAGPINAAEANGVYAIGYNSDMSEFGENAHLTAIEHRWGPLYLEKTQAVLEGRWRSEDVWPGIAQGIIDLSPMHKDVPQEVIELVAGSKSAIAEGQLHPFSGPIFNQQGETVLAAGATMSDADLLSINWYVRGIEGELPQ